jgi:hypothetical protein
MPSVNYFSFAEAEIVPVILCITRKKTRVGSPLPRKTSGVPAAGAIVLGVAIALPMKSPDRLPEAFDSHSVSRAGLVI